MKKNALGPNEQEKLKESLSILASRPISAATPGLGFFGSNNDEILTPDLFAGIAAPILNKTFTQQP